MLVGGGPFVSESPASDNGSLDATEPPDPSTPRLE